MRSSKRYTNTTFTKRVDHEAGHKSNRHPREPELCEKCGALYQRGHWTFDKAALNEERIREVRAQATICPACRQILNGEPAGFVYIEGGFLNAHKDEIENLLANEGKEARNTNPLARIMGLERKNNRLIVTTTTEKLAQQIGRSLSRAFGGDVRYDFSHENKLARVYWHRE